MRPCASLRRRFSLHSDTPPSTLRAGLLSLSMDEPLSLHRVGASGVVDAMAAALAAEMPAHQLGGGGLPLPIADNFVAAPWRPRGVLVRAGLSVCLSVCHCQPRAGACRSVWLSVCLPVCLSAAASGVLVRAGLCVCLFACLSVCRF
jgi:hypothetical protein